MAVKRKSWRDHEYMWVIGCIDSHGAITASPSKGGRTHSKEESNGHRWRWCVWSQEFCEVWAGKGIDEDETQTVMNWLSRRGYAD